MMRNDRKIWIKFILFSMMAIAFSAPFHLDVIHLKEPEDHSPIYNSLYVLYGIGPFLSANICFFIFRKNHVRTITIFGGRPWLTAILFVVMLLPGALIGLDVPFIENNHWAGFYAVIFTYIYCFLEEAGWRGFLQDTLRPFSVPLKYMLIGMVWYIWHLSFIEADSLLNQLIFFLILLFGSWAIGQAVERTKSVAISTFLHYIINFLLLGGLFKTDFNKKLIISIPLAVLVILAIIYWPKKLIRSEASYKT